MHILCVHREDINGELRIVNGRNIGIATGVVTIIITNTGTQPRHTGPIQSGHEGRMLHTVFFEFALFAFLHPVIAVESIGIQAGNHHRLVIETCGFLPEGAVEGQARFVPGAGNERRFAFRTHRSEEVHRFVVRIGQPNRHNHVTYTNIKRRMDQTREVKLLDGHFTTLLQLRFVFTVLSSFQFHSRARTAGLEFDLGTEHPFRRKLIV